MQAIQNIIGGDIRDGIINGAAILAGCLERDVFSAGYGIAIPGTDIAPTSDTIVDIASVTKVLATTTALLVCNDRGLVDFDAPLADYLPFAHDASLTLRHLATHTSGFSHPGGVRQYYAEDGRDIMANILRHLPLHPPGTHYEYTCWNFLILGRVVEELTGKSLAEFCRDEIFVPLRMRDTSLGTPASDDPRRLSLTIDAATPRDISDFIAYRVYRDGGCAGNAGAFSTAHDLATFCRCIMRHGAPIFSENMFREIATTTETFGDVKRSFGWTTANEFVPVPESSPNVITHSGWTGQTLYIDFDNDFFAVVLTLRTGDGTRAKRDRFAIINELLRTRKALR